MKLYLVWGTANDYDTFDSAIVAAENEEQARNTHPNGDFYEDMPKESWEKELCHNIWSVAGWRHDWAKSPEDVKVKEIGEATEGTKRGVILASFNAG